MGLVVGSKESGFDPFAVDMTTPSGVLSRLIPVKERETAGKDG
jgi:hypothetical protein